MHETPEDKLNKLKNEPVEKLMDEVFEIRNTGLQCLRLEQDFENNVLDLSKKHTEALSQISWWEKLKNWGEIQKNKELVEKILKERDETRVARFLNVLDILAQTSMFACAVLIYKKDELSIIQKQKLQDVTEFAIKLIERITKEKIPVQLKEKNSELVLIDYFSKPNFKFNASVLDREKFDYL